MAMFHRGEEGAEFETLDRYIVSYLLAMGGMITIQFNCSHEILARLTS